MTSHLPNAFARISRWFSQSSQLSIAQSAPSSASSALESSVVSASTVTDAQHCTVAAGCFWGVEHVYRKHFGTKGLLDAKVGYIGGESENPSYRAVCSGNTGYAEAADILFDSSQVSYRQLIEFFYRMHDPTTLNAQGNDQGTQYRSAIYFHNAEQEKIAREVTAQANEQWWGGRIVTEITPAGKWWTAEEYHQLYLKHNPFGYQCPTHELRDLPDLKA